MNSIHLYLQKSLKSDNNLMYVILPTTNLFILVILLQNVDHSNYANRQKNELLVFF
jgi:hypothetical protein